MKKTNLSWVGALLVFALLLWCTAATPGKIDDPSTYTCAVYSSALSLLPPVVAIVLALNTKEVYTSLLVGIATGALMAFTLSIDDFIISFFTTGQGVSNLSITLYSMAKTGINPSMNALSTLLFVAVLALLLLLNKRDIDLVDFEV